MRSCGSTPTSCSSATVSSSCRGLSRRSTGSCGIWHNRRHGCSTSAAGRQSHRACSPRCHPPPRSRAWTPRPRAFLRQGTARVSRLGLSDRVHVLEGDLSEGLDVPAADLVWAARVVHHLSDPVAGLVELGRLTSPGGLLAVIEGGLPIRVLPGGYGVGRPGFMSRLEAVLSDHFIDAYDLPERVTSGTEDWPLLMAEAGLEHLASRSFLLDLPAPVEPWVRAYLLDKFAHLWDMVGPKLDPPDAEALARLTDPTDSLGIHQRLDLFVLAAHTVHLATTH